MNLSGYYKTVDGDSFALDPEFSPILDRAERWLDKIDREDFWWRFEGRFVMWQMPLAMAESEIARRNKELWGEKHAYI